MKLLNGNITIKVMDKLTNPFEKRTSNINIKSIEETLYNLSNSYLSSYLSLSDSLLLEKDYRKTRMENIRSIRSRGSTLQFMVPSMHKLMVKEMSSLGEISYIGDNNILWLSEEDEIFPLFDISEMEYVEALNFMGINKINPLSSIKNTFHYL